MTLMHSTSHTLDHQNQILTIRYSLVLYLLMVGVSFLSREYSQHIISPTMELSELNSNSDWNCLHSLGSNEWIHVFDKSIQKLFLETGTTLPSTACSKLFEDGYCQVVYYKVFCSSVAQGLINGVLSETPTHL